MPSAAQGACALSCRGRPQDPDAVERWAQDFLNRLLGMEEAGRGTALQHAFPTTLAAVLMSAVFTLAMLVVWVVPVWL